MVKTFCNPMNFAIEGSHYLYYNPRTIEVLWASWRFFPLAFLHCRWGDGKWWEDWIPCGNWKHFPVLELFWDRVAVSLHFPCFFVKTVQSQCMWYLSFLVCILRSVSVLCCCIHMWARLSQWAENQAFWSDFLGTAAHWQGVWDKSCLMCPMLMKQMIWPALSFLSPRQTPGRWWGDHSHFHNI